MVVVVNVYVRKERNIEKIWKIVGKNSSHLHNLTTIIFSSSSLLSIEIEEVGVMEGEREVEGE